MITREDINKIRSIAARTLGNPEARAAKAARDAAVGRLCSACQRGESPEVLDRLEVEFRVLNAEYFRVKDWRR